MILEYGYAALDDLYDINENNKVAIADAGNMANIAPSLHASFAPIHHDAQILNVKRLKANDPNLSYLDLYDNSIGNQFNDNTITNDFRKNEIGYGFYNNNISGNTNTNRIGEQFENNTIFTGYFQSQGYEPQDAPDFLLLGRDDARKVLGLLRGQPAEVLPPYRTRQSGNREHSPQGEVSLYTVS